MPRLTKIIGASQHKISCFFPPLKPSIFYYIHPLLPPLFIKTTQHILQYKMMTLNKQSQQVAVIYALFSIGLHLFFIAKNDSNTLL